ncbi:MAG: hypothetical protein H0V31_10195, partial [Acidobacteria bacterium]|nr:hypothetical protein [Acidobacteriota bacterium]
FAALKRSKTLVKRSFRTILTTILMMFFIPIFISLFIAFFAKALVREFTPETEKTAVSSQNTETSSAQSDEISKAARINDEGEGNISISIGADKNVIIKNDKEDTNEGTRLRYAFREALTQIFYLPISILIVSFFTIVAALLYLKTRQVGGESMQDLLEQFEESDQSRSNWQRHIRDRLEQSGKLTSKT